MEETLGHADWRISETPLGKEITFAPSRSGRAYLVPLAAALVLSGLCGYGIFVFVNGWFSGEEILAGGLVVVLILTGGLLFAWRCLRLALRTERYILQSGCLRALSCKPGSSTEQIIEKQAVTEIVQLYTPPRETGQSGTWRTCLAYSGLNGKRNEFFFEGDSKEISDQLCALLGAWAGAPVRQENTME